MSHKITRYLLVAMFVLKGSAPAFAQSKEQMDKINKWFDNEATKKHNIQNSGDIQKGGKVQKAGEIQKAGQVQIPQGWKAIKSSELPCQKRYAISGDTLFEFDRDTLTPHAVQTLNLLVPELKKQDTHPVTVEGHTDSIGTDEYNQQLSFHRATRVKNWLIDNKVFDKDALKVVAHGKRIPVAPNTNPDGTDNPPGRQLNRRVEIVVNTCVTLEPKKPVEPTASEKPADTPTAASESPSGTEAKPDAAPPATEASSEQSGDTKKD